MNGKKTFTLSPWLDKSNTLAQINFHLIRHYRPCIQVNALVLLNQSISCVSERSLEYGSSENARGRKEKGAIGEGGEKNYFPFVFKHEKLKQNYLPEVFAQSSSAVGSEKT